MIKAPGWCSHAVPTTRGWKHPRTSEILKRRSISEAEIVAWHAGQSGTPAPVAAPAPAPRAVAAPVVVAKPAPVPAPVAVAKPAPVPAPVAVVPVEHMVTAVDLDSMSKDELEILGREHGIELDRRKAHNVLVSEVRAVINTK